MRNSYRRLRLAVPACLAALALTGAAQAQMTDSQKAGLKSSCRSDYIANCMSVSPGGIEALQCLQKNMAKLSPACQSAVNAAAPKAPPPAAAAPPPAASPPPKAAAAPPPAAEPPPSPTAVAVPPPAAPPAAVAAPPKAKTAGPKRAAPPPKQVIVAPPPAAAPPPPAAPVITAALIAKIEKLPLPKRLALAKACGKDKDALCSQTRPGKASLVVCLIEHTPSLSPYCNKTLTATLQ